MAQVAKQSLHEADGESLAGGLVRDDGWRKLAVVASQHDAPGAEQRNPAGGLDGLGGFVDHDEVEGPVVEHLAIDARQRGAEDRGRTEQMLGDLRLNAAGVGE